MTKRRERPSGVDDPAASMTQAPPTAASPSQPTPTASSTPRLTAATGSSRCCSADTELLSEPYEHNWKSASGLCDQRGLVSGGSANSAAAGSPAMRGAMGARRSSLAATRLRVGFVRSAHSLRRRDGNLAQSQPGHERRRRAYGGIPTFFRVHVCYTALSMLPPRSLRLLVGQKHSLFFPFFFLRKYRR